MSKKPGPNTELRIADREGAVRRGERARSPSHHADLERLFDAHRERVLKLCRRMTGDPQRAEEIVQETLLVAYQRLPEFHGGARFGTWIYGIARNLCLNAVRKRSDLLSEDGLIEGESESGVWRALRREERGALIRRAVANLPADEAEAAHLRYVEGLELARIDALLGLTGSGARAVLQRAKRRLRAEVARELEALGHGRSFLDSAG